jgi:hypothetical protein
MGCGALIGLALSAAGTGAEEYANVSDNNAANAAANSQVSRENQLEKQGQAVFNNSLQQSTPQAAQNQQQQGAAQILGASKAAQLPGLSLGSMDTGNNANANNVSFVGSQAENQLGQNANAQLQGYNNVNLQQSLADQQARNQLGTINSNAQTWQNAFPLQLQQAANSNSGLSALGSLLGTAGSVAGLSGLASGGLGSNATPIPGMNPGSLVNYSQLLNYPGAQQLFNGFGSGGAANNYLNLQGLGGI